MHNNKVNCPGDAHISACNQISGLLYVLHQLSQLAAVSTEQSFFRT